MTKEPDTRKAWDDIAEVAGQLYESYGTWIDIARAAYRYSDQRIKVATFQAILAAARKPQNRRAFSIPDDTLEHAMQAIMAVPLARPPEEVAWAQRRKEPRTGKRKYDANIRAWAAEFEQVAGLPATHFTIHSVADGEVVLTRKVEPQIGQRWIRLADGLEVIVTKDWRGVALGGKDAGREMHITNAWRLKAPQEE